MDYKNMWIQYKKKLLEIIDGTEAQRDGKKGVAIHSIDMYKGGLFKALFLMDEMELNQNEN